MSHLRFLAWRFVGLVASAWAVFTLAFCYVAWLPYSAELLATDAVASGPGDPLLVQYLDWLGWLLTVWDEPVVDRVVVAVKYTTAYLVPGMLLAVCLGVAIRTYTVAAPDRRLDRATTLLTYVAVGVPIFLLAFLLRRYLLVPYFEVLGTVRIYSYAQGPWTVRNLVAAVWPGAAMTVYLLAIELHYAGETLREYVSEPFVRTARAKGAGTWRVGRHLLRNAAIPLVSVFLTDLLGMVLVGVFVVEFVAATPGVSVLLIEAVLGRDLPLLLTLSVGLVLVGVTGTVVQDVGERFFDPRIDAE